jgi:hypothetical protein
MRKIVGKILLYFGVACLALLNFYNGTLIIYKYLWMAVCFGIAAFGLYISIKSQMKTDAQARNLILDKINILKTTGEKIIVNIDDCDFLEQQYQEEIVDENVNSTYNKIKAYDALAGYHEKAIEYKKVLKCIVIFNYLNPISNEQEVYKSAAVNCAKTSLHFQLLQKNNVAIYVNRKNRKEYYFDLGF